MYFMKVVFTLQKTLGKTQGICNAMNQIEGFFEIC